METNYNNNGRQRSNGIGFAVLLITIGALFLLFNLDIIPAIYKPILISWKMLLIGLGIWSLFKRKYLGGSILIIIGSVFLYPAICHLFPDMLPCFDANQVHVYWHAYWPVLLIILGGILIISKWSCPNRCRRSKKCGSNKEYEMEVCTNRSSSDYIDKNLLFSGAKHIVLSQNFKGGKANIMFAGLEVDLRKANLHEGHASIEVNVAFGGVTILVPAEWDVNLECDTILGGFEDNRSAPNITILNAPKLTIKGNCMFGGGEIKN